MDTMKALLLTAYGPPKESLAIRTIPRPTLDESSDDILVRVIATCMNPLDWKIAQGDMKMIKKETFPTPMGYDLSGVVEKAGRASNFKPGEEVIACTTITGRGKSSSANKECKRTMAEYVIVSASLCALKPKTLSHEEAACLPIGGLTAMQALQMHQGAKDVALIPAGLGGVGSIALQLAKAHFGFKKVITTVSTSKVDMVKEAAPDVDQVIDYKTTNLTDQIPAHSVDFILDSIGKPSAWVPFISKAAERKPSIISIAAIPPSAVIEAGWEISLPWYLKAGADMMDWNTRRSIPKHVKYAWLFALPNAENLATMARLADEGKLKPIVYKVFKLDEAVEAFELASSGKAAGKIAIRVADWL